MTRATQVAKFESTLSKSPPPIIGPEDDVKCNEVSVGEAVPAPNPTTANCDATPFHDGVKECF